MNTHDTASWSGDIRRYVLEMLVLLILLLALGACYSIWADRRLEGIEREANTFHLATNAHYLRAMQELRKIQIHPGFLIAAQTEDSITGASPNQDSDITQLLTMNHIVHQEILKGLALEHYFSDNRFSLLSNKLEQ